VLVEIKECLHEILLADRLLELRRKAVFRQNDACVPLQSYFMEASSKVFRLAIYSTASMTPYHRHQWSSLIVFGLDYPAVDASFFVNLNSDYFLVNILFIFFPVYPGFF